MTTSSRQTAMVSLQDSYHLPGGARVVTEYRLALASGQFIKMHKGARPLTGAWRDGKLKIWMLANPAEEKVYRAFRIAPTGQIFPFRPTDQYVGSVPEGHHVWHIWAGPEHGLEEEGSENISPTPQEDKS